MKRPSPSWQRRAFLVFLSQSITLFGSTLSQMAIVWYLTLDTTSGAWVAAAMVCNTLPQCLLSFPGGVWADRYAKKPLILGADGAIAGITLVTLPLVSVGSPPRGLLLLLLVLRSLGAGIQTPAVNALIPQLVPPADRMQYNGYFASLQGVAQFAAPAVAGLLMTWFPLGAALMADILTALLGMGLFAWVSLPTERGSKPRDASTTTIRENLSHQGIRPVLAVYGCFIALTVPSGYLAQLLAARVYGEHYGILTAVELAGFSGMCLGGLVMGHFSGRTRLLAHPGWVSGALWRAVGCDGLGGALTPVSLLDGNFRRSAHRCANHHHHTAPRNRPTGSSGEGLRPSQCLLCWRTPLGYGDLWSHGRCHPASLSHDPRRRTSPWNCRKNIGQTPTKYGIMRCYKICGLVP